MGGHVTGADSAGTCSSSERVVMLLGLTLLAHGSSEWVVMLLGLAHVAALRGWSCYWGLTLLVHGSFDRVVMLLGADSAGTWQL